MAMYVILYQRLSRVMPQKDLVFFLLTIFVMENAGGQKDMAIYGSVLIAVARIYQLSNNKYSDKSKIACANVTVNSNTNRSKAETV